uniref:Transporter n=1 Tax=Phallusia mammillata TaxID=59560 RepID=A0A6F9DTL3_9ASCI|nr:sodium- and chloride-dependent neutral and basic amino acid transporter B(0+)-like [Phallusia mammillata]
MYISSKICLLESHNNTMSYFRHCTYSSALAPRMASLSNDENTDRGNWDNKADYLLSCIGYAVGLGNVWRFPYLAYENGGGAFIIPYVVMLVFAGLPIFFMEVALGQFSSLGPTAVWKFSPIFKGVGVCMVVLSAMVGIYYNVIIAYTVFYFFSSLTSLLPWESCKNWWNNATTCSAKFIPVCNINLTGVALTPDELQFVNFSNNSFIGGSMDFMDVLQADAESFFVITSRNGSEYGCEKFIGRRQTSPSEEYWNFYALNKAPGIDTEYTGNVNSHLALSLLVAWIVVFYSLIKGVKSSGKVVYFTALFPYLVLLILLIRGATLEGAYDGVQYYIGYNSDLERLKDANVWKAAATQIFFSLSAAWGGLIALSSYNKFNNNCFYDAVLVCSVNCATSLFAGFAIFTVVGHMAHVLGKPVPDVVDSGFGLAFVAYPEAIAQLPVSPLWAILFFLMLFTLGLDSQFTILETVSTAIIDAYPRQLRSRRWQLMLVLSVVMFLLGLVCVTNTGIYWVDLIDHYAAGWGLLIVAVMELFGVCYIYGGNRFIEDIEMMIGKKHWAFWIFWRACWFFISPLLLTAILVWSLVTFKGKAYGSGESYPEWANAIGWLIIAFGIVFIPLFAIIAIIQKKGNIFKAASPSSDWGPYLKQHRGQRYANIDEPREAIEIAKAINDTKTPGAENPVYEDEENYGQTKM